MACALVLQAQIPNYEKNFANARRSYAQGRFQEAEWSMVAALAEVENASPDDPRFATVLFDLAEIQHAQGKYSDAAAVLEKLLRFNEGHPGPDSDFDLLVLVRGVDDVRQLAGRIRGALRGIPAAFDIVVRDEDAWRKWADVPLTMEYHVEHDGKVLHDAG